MNNYMISYYLLVIGVILFLVSIFNMVIKYIKYKGVVSRDISGYDICKRLIDKHKISGVNIVETREWLKNICNISRRVIRLGFNSYYNKNCYDLGISSFLAGYCILNDNKNVYIRNLGRIFSKISYVSISSVIVILVSYLFSGYYAIVGIVILVVLFIYQYFRKCISNEVVNIVSGDIDGLKELDKDSKRGIKDVIKGIDFCYNVGLFITLLQVCRLVIYMM